MHILCNIFRFLKGKKSPRRDWLFRECMMVSAYARELREFKEAAYKKNLGKSLNISYNQKGAMC